VLLLASTWNWIVEHGLLLFPLILGFLAVWTLLPQHRHRHLLLGCLAGVSALVLGGMILPQAFGPGVPLSYELLFYPFAGMAVLSGVLMIIQRNPVHSALWFAIVILNTCGLFLLQGGTFLAAATIIIYTGAIIVTFLFVMMLAQQTGTADYDRRSREPFLASLAGFVLLGGLLYALELTYASSTQAADRRMAAIRARLGSAQKRLQEGAKPDDVVKELKVQDNPRLPARSLTDLLGEEAEKHPSWAGRKNVQLRLENVKTLLSQREPDKVREAIKQLSGLVDDISLAGTEDIGKLAPPKDATKVSTLSKFDTTPAKNVPPPAPKQPFQPKPGHVTGLGKSLFGDYLYGVMLSAELLLVVTIGAIVITHRRKEAAA
jgi:NADH-quinone oxidoreductase subunit J